MGHDYPVLAGDGHDLPKRAHVSPPADLGVQKCDFSNIALNRAGNFSVLLLEENSSCHIRSFPVSRLSQETAQLTGVSLQPLPTLLSPQAVSGFTGGSHTAGLWGEAPCGPWPVSFSLASGELHLSTRPPTLGRLWWSSPQPGKPLRGPWTSSCWGHFLAAPPAVKRPSSSPAGHRTPASLRAQQARPRGRGVCSPGARGLQLRGLHPESRHSSVCLGFQSRFLYYPTPEVSPKDRGPDPFPGASSSNPLMTLNFVPLTCRSSSAFGVGSGSEVLVCFLL